MNFMEYQNKETEEKLPFIIDLTFSKNIPVPGIKIFLSRIAGLETLGDRVEDTG
jgi:hypothetical protein